MNISQDQIIYSPAYQICKRDKIVYKRKNTYVGVGQNAALQIARYAVSVYVYVWQKTTVRYDDSGEEKTVRYDDSGDETTARYDDSGDETTARYDDSGDEIR
ncbi:hypothetical protein SLE2022_378170 [Rubroshorea leprosula]